MASQVYPTARINKGWGECLCRPKRPDWSLACGRSSNPFYLGWDSRPNPLLKLRLSSENKKQDSILFGKSKHLSCFYPACGPPVLSPLCPLGSMPSLHSSKKHWLSVSEQISDAGGKIIQHSARTVQYSPPALPASALPSMPCDSQT